MPIDAEQWRAQTGLFCASRVLLRPPRYKQPQPKVLADTLSVNMGFSLAVLLVTLRTGVSYVSRTLHLLWMIACHSSRLLSSIIRGSCKRLQGVSVLLALCLVVVPMLLIMSGDVEENPGPPKIQGVFRSCEFTSNPIVCPEPPPLTCISSKFTNQTTFAPRRRSGYTSSNPGS